jgi:hypothetical protein
MLQSFLDAHPLPALHRPHIDDSKHL